MKNLRAERRSFLRKVAAGAWATIATQLLGKELGVTPKMTRDSFVRSPLPISENLQSHLLNPQQYLQNSIQLKRLCIVGLPSSGLSDLARAFYEKEYRTPNEFHFYTDLSFRSYMGIGDAVLSESEKISLLVQSAESFLDSTSATDQTRVMLFQRPQSLEVLTQIIDNLLARNFQIISLDQSPSESEIETAAKLICKGPALTLPFHGIPQQRLEHVMRYYRDSLAQMPRLPISVHAEKNGFVNFITSRLREESQNQTLPKPITTLFSA